jgi:DNA-binding MarR family transcriptional regulator
MIRNPNLPSGPGGEPPRSRDHLIREFTELHWQLSLRLKASVASQMEAAPAQLARLAASTTPHQRQAVMVLARGGALTMSELARRLMISPSSATELADRLVERGWVERTPDPSDRRTVVIRLSDRASQQANAVDRMLHAGVAELLSPLGDFELAGLVELLRPLATAETARPHRTGALAPGGDRPQ